ncbi:MAG TPA: DNA polymerase III subunit beta [Candidatus Acidoferrales bacterium]|nr:DNA polymerase III subunit beta [Candidatus Acidoferrales bacterium]
MEFTVTMQDLVKELSLTQGVVERKTTIPILSNILLETEKDRLVLTATDLELSIRTSCNAKMKTEGAATIPAKKLLDLVRLLPGGDIRFKLLDNHWVQIVSDRKTYKLVGLSKENFPALPAVPPASVGIPSKVLSDLIAKTAFAISTEESRYTLNGALAILKPDGLTMVATDGHRLSLAEADAKLSGLPGEVRALVPRKALVEITRLVAEEGEPAEGHAELAFAQDESHLFFQIGPRLLISRRLTGQFPNYLAVLPRDNNKVVVLDRNEFQDALRRVSQLADQRSHVVKLVVASEGIELSASSPDYGEAKEAIEREYKGEPIAIGFNADYLLDFLAAAPEGPVSLELKDGESAGQFRPQGESGTHYRYVVMPMRI